MSSRRAVLTECAKRLRTYAGTLEGGGLRSISQRVLQWADKVQADDFVNVVQDYKSFLDEFKREATQGDPKQVRIYEALKEILESAKGKSISLTQLDSIVQPTRGAQQAVAQVIKSFQSKGLTIEQSFYGLCFAYLLMVEGVYDKVMRYLLAWCKWPVDIAELPEKINPMMAELLKIGSYEVLFEDYHRRIRNSIAHANFWFDATLSMAIFDDVNPDDPNDKFHCEKPYDKFVQTVVGLYSVLFLFQVALLMIIFVPVTLLEAKNAQ